MSLFIEPGLTPILLGPPGEEGFLGLKFLCYEVWALGPALCFFSRVRNLGIASPERQVPAFLGIGPSVCVPAAGLKTLPYVGFQD